MFHVALKFQYLHTSALPPCTFALATLKTPGGGDPGIKATRGDNGGLTMHIAGVEIMLHHHSLRLPLRLHLGHHQWCLHVVVVPDDGGGSGVSGVSDVQNPPQPSHPRKSLKPKQKAMPRPEDSAKRQPKVKAKPKPSPPTNSGVAGARSPSAGVKRKTVRLEAASASSALSRGGGNSEASANQISLRKPLQGETFTIYSAGRSQASNRDFQSPKI